VHIDWWTIALQAANFLLLAWLLQHFLYRPVLAVIARRQAATERVMTEANVAKERAQSVEHELGDRLRQAESARSEMLAAARRAAEDDRKALLVNAAAEAKQLRGEGLHAVDREREAALQQLSETAARLAVTMARRLLAELPLETAEQAFLEHLHRALVALPPDQRSVFTGSKEAAPVTVVSAAPLSESGRTRCQSSIHEMLGQAIAIRFEVDSDLLGGLDLHAGGATLRLSWADQLARIGAGIEAAADAHA
jgi:F-type H+-transporting ATPase subunit b